ncbi:MAG: carbohydrate kinase [Beijerinckiaceae bacterium]|nr:carbohydrate kinase [Beijerinckiaceae bacterium]
MACNILVIGETILDLTPLDGDAAFAPALGGSAFNTARALGSLGADAAFAGAISRDEWGARFRHALEDARVDCALLRACDEPMPLALVSPEGASGPQFTLYLDGTAHMRALAPAALPQGVGHLHVSSFHACMAPTGESVLALMRQAKGRASISFDPNVRPGVLPPRESALRLIEERVALCDVVKASAQDMDWLYPGRDPLDAMNAWSAMGPRLAILTRGGEGATALCNGERISVSAPPVDVADTVGAGDAFTAGLLAMMADADALGPDAFARTPDPAQLRSWLAFAAAAGAWTCGQRRAQAPNRAQIAPLFTR